MLKNDFYTRSNFYLTKSYFPIICIFLDILFSRVFNSLPYVAEVSRDTMWKPWYNVWPKCWPNSPKLGFLIKSSFLTIFLILFSLLIYKIIKITFYHGYQTFFKLSTLEHFMAYNLKNRLRSQRWLIIEYLTVSIYYMFSYVFLNMNPIFLLRFFCLLNLNACQHGHNTNFIRRNI